MEEQYIHIIKQKNFEELSSKERSEMSDWFSSEDEFNDLKHLFIGVDSYKSTVENEKNGRKKELDALFVNVYSNKPSFDWKGFFFPTIKPFFKQPGFQLGFGIVITLIVSIVFVNNPASNSTKIAKNIKTVTKIDIQKSPKKNSFIEDGLAEKPQIAAVSDRKEKSISLAESTKINTNDWHENTDEISLMSSGISSHVTTNTLFFQPEIDNSISFSYRNEQVQKSDAIPPLSEQPEILDYLFATY